MGIPVFIACSQLLKDICVACLQVAIAAELVLNAQEKTIVIKIIVDNLLPKTDMQLVIGNT